MVAMVAAIRCGTTKIRFDQFWRCLIREIVEMQMGNTWKLDIISASDFHIRKCGE